MVEPEALGMGLPGVQGWAPPNTGVLEAQPEGPASVGLPGIVPGETAKVGVLPPHAPAEETAPGGPFIKGKLEEEEAVAIAPKDTAPDEPGLATGAGRVERMAPGVGPYIGLKANWEGSAAGGGGVFGVLPLFLARPGCGWAARGGIGVGVCFSGLPGKASPLGWADVAKG